MKEQELQLVTKEQSIKLRYCGFDWKTKRGFLGDELWDDWYDQMYLSDHYYRRLKSENLHPAPTVSLACKWLRDYKKIHVSLQPNYNSEGCIYFCTVVEFSEEESVSVHYLKDKPLTIDYTPFIIYNTYEESESAGLDYALDLLLKKK
jgi:hypothetical protein